MRVLLVHNRYRTSSPGGEDRVVDQESRALSAGGHTVEHFERSNDEIGHSSIGRKALVPGQVLWSEKARRSLTGVLRAFRPDVAHVHNTFPLISPSVLYACHAEKVPVVATLHHYRLACPRGDLFRDKGVCHDCVGRLPIPAIRHGCYRGSPLATLPVAASAVAHASAWRRLISAYVFLSQAQRDILSVLAFPPDRVFIKPNFVPDDPIPTVRQPGVVVYAGRLTESKGLNILMHAWDLYSRSPPEGLRLAIAGGGPMERQVALWAKSHSSVEWIGALSWQDCASLIAGSQAVIVPSRWEEPFGLVAVEAMAAGVPPVASARGSFPELITDGYDGVLFDADNVAALAKVFDDIHHAPHRYEAYGRRARRTYERRFGPEANLQELLRIYHFAVRNPPR